KPWYRMRACRVFRDKTGLEVTETLWPAIERAIDASRFFILLASPESASSSWVSRELMAWKRRGSAPIIVLTDGVVVWSNEARDFDWKATTALARSCFTGWLD